ncbi:MAG: radical SAM protein [Desulfovibrionaceae bacterium]|nr:radical SAM protein [Desulfovibrionaceae bacterium]
MTATSLPWRRTLGALLRGRVPGQLVIQYTDHCNALCAQCGMNARSGIPRSVLGADKAVALVDAAAEKGFLALSFTGGEPLLHLGEIAELSRRARTKGIPLVRTGTNGFLFRGHEKPDFPDRMRRLAETVAESGLNNFWISLDSADPAVHERNRGLPGMVRGVEKALPVFREFGLYPAANLGVNRLVGGGTPPPPAAEDPDGFREHFLAAFLRFYSFAESLGFTTVNACYPMSLPEDRAREQAVYAATSADDMVRFSGLERPLLYRALLAAVESFRHRLRVFTPRSALLSLIREHEGGEAAFPCRGGVDFFFVQAGGLTAFPCGYRGGEPLGPFPDLDVSRLSRRASCSACDWECFRDPSVLAGPLLELAMRPLAGVWRLLRDRELARAWLDDLRYSRACGNFSLRSAPDAWHMARFARRAPTESGLRPIPAA